MEKFLTTDLLRQKHFSLNPYFLVCLFNWNFFLLQMPVDEAACKYIALELVILQCNK